MVKTRKMTTDDKISSISIAVAVAVTLGLNIWDYVGAGATLWWWVDLIIFAVVAGATRQGLVENARDKAVIEMNERQRDAKASAETGAPPR